MSNSAGQRSFTRERHQPPTNAQRREQSYRERFGIEHQPPGWRFTEAADPANADRSERSAVQGPRKVADEQALHNGSGERASVGNEDLVRGAALAHLSTPE